MADSVRPHRWQPTRLPCPWDSPGKNTGVGCHFLLQCMKMKSESEVSQLCPTLCDPMDCSLPGSSAHGIFQARVLEWGAITFSDVCVCITKSLLCIADSDITLQINYTSIKKLLCKNVQLSSCLPACLPFFPYSLPPAVSFFFFPLSLSPPSSLFSFLFLLFCLLANSFSLNFFFSFRTF